MNTSPAGKGNQDTRLGHALREVKDRLRRLENGGPVWIITENAAGDLVAYNRVTKVSRVIASRED